jgi:uncharacterized protein (UPF0276 family)
VTGSSLAGRVGLGLRVPHVAEVTETRPVIGWWEVHAENHLGGGPARRQLETIRRDYPIAVHGVGLSLGTADPPDARHLDRVRRLIEWLEPALVSEHLSWSIAGGAYLNHLLPLPCTEESLALLSRNVETVQVALGRRLLIENPSSYLRFRHSPIAEPDFLTELARRTGCGLLCDVNNLYVSTQNFGVDARAYLDAIPATAVGEIHLAGHARNEADGRTILVDDHGSRVGDPVWRLYQHALERFGPVPTLIEWDTDLPALDVLMDEARRAERRLAAGACASASRSVPALPGRDERRAGLGGPRPGPPCGSASPPILKTLQSEFRGALLGGEDGQPAGPLGAEILADGLSPEARLAIYRHHVRTTLASVLKGAYPVVVRLVGDGFFAYAADAFVRRHPPDGPCLFEYGAGFAAFLASFPPCHDLVYLPDVARLEWAMNAALHAPDALAADRERLRGIPAEAISAITLRFDPSVTLLSSAWPIEAIWRANQPGADPEATIDLRSGGACLEIRRLGDDVVWRTLPPAEHAFRGALGAGQTLERAADAALTVDADFDLADALHRLLGEEIVVAFEVPS